MKVETTPISASWLEDLKENGFTADAIFDEGQHEDLKKLLLDIGGEAVVLPRVEQDKKLIMVDGYLIVPETVYMEKGDPSECHKNSAKLWKEYGYEIVTGYGLSKDGVWRQHTWTQDKELIIHETTEKREAYFGFNLEQEEAEEFFRENAF